jgi:hypothetical protein
VDDSPRKALVQAEVASTVHRSLYGARKRRVESAIGMMQGPRRSAAPSWKRRAPHHDYSPENDVRLSAC